MACEYLILNGSKINCQDKDGKTSLYLATELGEFFFSFQIKKNLILLKHTTYGKVTRITNELFDRIMEKRTL